MRKLVLFIALSISTITFAQNSKDVGDYQKVIIFDKIEVTLKKGKEQKIEIEGTNADDVQVVNKNGVLKVKMNLTNSLQGSGVKAVLYYNELEEVVAEEGAKIGSNEVIKATNLIVNAKTGSTITLKVDVDKLKVKAYTGGTIKLDGKANNQDILSNAGGFIENASLSTKETVVTVNAGGTADVKASDLVDAKTRAGGEIRIYGNPKTVNQKTIAGGNIKQIKK